MFKKLLEAMFVCMLFVTAATSTADDKPAAPPYLNYGVNLISVGVVWEEALLRKMLPAGVKPTKDFTGGFNIYRAARGYGIAPFDSFYAWADVEGMDAADGTKGRWMLGGAYGPSEKTTAATRDFMGFPVRNGSIVQEETTQGRRATGYIQGQAMMVAEVRSSALPCAPVGGTLSYIVEIKGKLMVNRIPYAGDWCGGELVSFKNLAPAGDAFAALVPAKVVWAGEFRNGSAAFTPPAPIR